MLLRSEQTDLIFLLTFPVIIRRGHHGGFPAAFRPAVFQQYLGSGLLRESTMRTRAFRISNLANLSGVSQLRVKSQWSMSLPFLDCFYSFCGVRVLRIELRSLICVVAILCESTSHSILCGLVWVLFIYCVVIGCECASHCAVCDLCGCYFIVCELGASSLRIQSLRIQLFRNQSFRIQLFRNKGLRKAHSRSELSYRKNFFFL